MNAVTMPLVSRHARIVAPTEQKRSSRCGHVEESNQIPAAMRAASVNARSTKPQLTVVSAEQSETGAAPLSTSLRALGYSVSVGGAAFEVPAPGADSVWSIIIVALTAEGAEKCFSRCAALDVAGGARVLLCAPVEVVHQLAWARFHDFLAVPFAVGELAERVRRLTQRPEHLAMTARSDLLQVDDLVIDLAARDVFLGTCAVRLTRLEFDLLAFFAANPRRVLRRAELLASVWGIADSFSRTVDIHLRRLRVKIGDEGRLIQTVRGVGYKLVAEVRPASCTAGA